jgi:hypothetical protein
MRTVTTRKFYQWTEKQAVSVDDLKEAADELANGLYDADLGGHLFKKRVGVGNIGKRSGVRTIICFERNKKTIFIHGFAKNEQANITKKELKAFKLLAKIFLALSDKEFDIAIKKGDFVEL